MSATEGDWLEGIEAGMAGYYESEAERNALEYAREDYEAEHGVEPVELEGEDAETCARCHGTGYVAVEDIEAICTLCLGSGSVEKLEPAGPSFCACTDPQSSGRFAWCVTCGGIIE